jgi:hypothetical protein
MIDAYGNAAVDGACALLCTVLKCLMFDKICCSRGIIILDHTRTGLKSAYA